MNVYLVRHTSVDVPKGVCYGQSDVDVKDSFAEEARDVSNRLKDMNLHWDAVYCSPLSRCRKLATFCGYPNAVVEPKIMEINFGKWEMLPFNEIKDPRLDEWFKDYLNVRATGGESFNDQFVRVSQFLGHLKGQGYENVLLFTHGGVIICAKLATGMIVADEAFSSLDDYGSIVKVVV